jgi:hypothetical protein
VIVSASISVIKLQDFKTTLHSIDKEAFAEQLLYNCGGVVANTNTMNTQLIEDANKLNDTNIVTSMLISHGMSRYRSY